MKLKPIVKVIIDMAIMVLLLLLMTFERIGGAVHEWLGIAAFRFLLRCSYWNFRNNNFNAVRFSAHFIKAIGERLLI